jgi:hypothetical protein
MKGIMDTIQINTGIKRIKVTRDDGEEYILVFNPSDEVFAEKFYKIIQAFDERRKEFEGRAQEIDSMSGVDDLGLDKNIPERLAFMKEIVLFIESQIDYAFGAGASRGCFGDALSLDMFDQFFSQILPFVEKARSEKITRYTNPNPPPQVRRKRKK